MREGNLNQPQLGANVNLGSRKLVNKRLSSLDQYGDGGLVVPKVLSIMESAVVIQSDLSSAYKSYDERVSRVKVIVMWPCPEKIDS